MSMTYAQTLQSTAEAEFLRYRKITADGREIEVDPQDLYDARVGPAYRPDPAQRLVPPAAPPVLPQGQRLPDLR